MHNLCKSFMLPRQLLPYILPRRYIRSANRSFPVRDKFLLRRFDAYAILIRKVIHILSTIVVRNTRCLLPGTSPNIASAF